MSLSDRLAAAADARARADRFGTTVHSLPVLFDHGVALAEPEPALPAKILISGSPAVAAVEPDPTADPNSICPTCARTGELGVVDLPGRTSDYSCSACGTMWRVNLDPAPSR